ncbi:MAG TPA: hypothetical protein VKC55_01045 [Actinomycetota bacterium]|nr:hypothetical protein [Actinomycetota bacterium]
MSVHAGWPRSAAFVAAAALLLAACSGSGSTDGSGLDPGTGAPVPASPQERPTGNTGPDSSAAAAARLCEVPRPKPNPDSGVPAEGPTPPVIQQVMKQVAQIRGFGYDHPVVAEPVSQAEIGRDVVAYTDQAYPKGQYARRSIAWDTIGVVPDGTDLRAAYESYGSSQVIGYYDTITGTLKFTGSASPSPLERITLAHELTHAIDDQRFGLERLDELGAECRDEDSAAATALVEGNATFFMLRWAQTFLTAAQQVQVGVEAAQQDTSTDGIPPFLVRLEAFPYQQGMTFVSALDSRGGLKAVDQAFEHLPVSTEQIIHPERYPNDAPTPVNVPDLSAELGEGWKDLDVMTIGEEWLQIALGLRLDPSQASTAAAGWDGGTYRAWSNGDASAVVLSTVWDTVADASQFADAMNAWIADGDGSATVIEPSGTHVTVLFASDDATLQTLRAAAA